MARGYARFASYDAIQQSVANRLRGLIFLKIRAVGKAKTLPETGGLGNHDYSYPSKSGLISKSYGKLARVVPWLRRFVEGLSPRRQRFNPRAVHYGFLVDLVAVRQGCL